VTMGKKDRRVDAYIAKQADFAKPILTYFRDAIHEGCPSCEEDLKWNSPAFMYQGGILAGCAAFKQHVQVGFWKHDLLFPKQKRVGMGFGKVTSVDELPPRKELLRLVKKAMEVQESGAKSPMMKRSPRKAIPLPSALKAALAKNKKAKAAYDSFPPSHKREYHEWIADAKGDDTRARRVAQAIEWMAEGKARNWKYM
jgi:uncharacterized protein YdeI (YjbR/CyaY-like superfamily)